METDTWYCHHCAATKTRADVRQAVRHETCLYVCRQCGAEEGLWLVWPDDERPACRTWPATGQSPVGGRHP